MVGNSLLRFFHTILLFLASLSLCSSLVVRAISNPNLNLHFLYDVFECVVKNYPRSKSSKYLFFSFSQCN